MGIGQMISSRTEDIFEDLLLKAMERRGYFLEDLLLSVTRNMDFLMSDCENVSERSALYRSARQVRRLFSEVNASLSLAVYSTAELLCRPNKKQECTIKHNIDL